jgi:4-hydroxy-tetrahydrodipicolinate synthase
MMKRLEGVIAATPTPLREDLSIDPERLTEHCLWLLDEGGCDGVNLLGTTGEAMSFSVAQRLQAMRDVARAGVPLERMMVGTGAASLEDAAVLTAAARDLGFAGQLVVPPFYHKPVPDDGVVAYFDALIARTGAAGLRLYLYHIPQNTGVPFGMAAIARIRERHGDAVLGLKDSAGDLAYAREVVRGFPGFDVFPGSEGSLLEARASGFRGCISATTNITGVLARRAWREPDSDVGREAGARAVAIRTELARYPLVVAVKCALGVLKGDPSWLRLCPPNMPLGEHDAAGVGAALRSLVRVNAEQ